MEQPLEQRTYAEDPIYFMRVYLFVMMLSMAYALSQPVSSSKVEKDILLTATAPDTSNQGWKDLPPWQKEASVKAVEKYTAIQEKKWRRWNEAMFEKVS